MLQYAAFAFGIWVQAFLVTILKAGRKHYHLLCHHCHVYHFVFCITWWRQCIITCICICMGLGFGSGISVLYITMSAEQFGTNLRATAAISIPNLVRGFLPLISLLFQYLRSNSVTGEYVTGAWITGVVVMTTGFIAVLCTKETFGKDLNFTEK